MARKRRTRWYDLMGSAINIPSSAAGSIGSGQFLTETTIEEELDGACTLLKIVGDIYLSRAVGANGVFVGVLRVIDSRLSTPGYTLADLRLGEDYEDSGVLWTRIWSDEGLSATDGHIPVDVSTKRRIGQQQRLEFAYNNLALTAGTDNINLTYHLRALILLS